MGLDLLTAFSAAATSIAVVGPGLSNEIGPLGNFSNLPNQAKWLLSAAMIIGRLEFFSHFNINNAFIFGENNKILKKYYSI